ncbi:hypothetical protein CTA2_1941 [Colletotrichum tanaceti]|nr:hypothetical protein CTA2_1941 [Colletotrichum tanaceti]
MLDLDNGGAMSRGEHLSIMAETYFAEVTNGDPWHCGVTLREMIAAEGYRGIELRKVSEKDLAHGPIGNSTTSEKKSNAKVHETAKATITRGAALTALMRERLPQASPCLTKMSMAWIPQPNSFSLDKKSPLYSWVAKVEFEQLYGSGLAMRK